jgi:hypothetical protein
MLLRSSPLVSALLLRLSLQQLFFRYGQNAPHRIIEPLELCLTGNVRGGEWLHVRIIFLISLAFVTDYNVLTK